MKTSRGLVAILIVSVLASVIGCGGGGSVGTGSSGGPGGSPYAGNWSGTFSDQIPINGDGSLAMSISGGGNFTGHGHNDPKDADFTISGAIDASGNLTGHMTSGSAHGDLVGQLTVTPSTLSGSVTLSNATTSSQLNLQLSK